MRRIRREILFTFEDGILFAQRTSILERGDLLPRYRIECVLKQPSEEVEKGNERKENLYRI